VEGIVGLLVRFLVNRVCLLGQFWWADDCAGYSRYYRNALKGFVISLLSQQLSGAAEAIIFADAQNPKRHRVGSSCSPGRKSFAHRTSSLLRPGKLFTIDG